MLRAVSREAVRQICRVFREMFVRLVAENGALTERVGRLEAEMKSPVGQSGSAQTVYKIKPSGETRRPSDTGTSCSAPRFFVAPLTLF